MVKSFEYSSLFKHKEIERERNVPIFAYLSEREVISSILMFPFEWILFPVFSFYSSFILKLWKDKQGLDSRIFIIRLDWEKEKESKKIDWEMADNKEKAPEKPTG